VHRALLATPKCRVVGATSVPELLSAIAHLLSGPQLGETKDGSWVIVGAVERGSLADRFPEFRSGARITGIRGGGQAHSRPTLRQAAALFATATGDIEVSFKPLLDRFGFICAMDEFSARIETRDQVRQARSRAGPQPRPALWARHESVSGARACCPHPSP
jgi:hypothetical protein